MPFADAARTRRRGNPFEKDKIWPALAESISSPSREDFAAMLEASFDDPRPGRRHGGPRHRRRDRKRFRDHRCGSEDRRPRGAQGILDARPTGRASRSGDEVEVYVERIENALGEAVLSRDKARREESWIRIEKAFNEQTRVTGVIFGRVKGGFTVDLDGAVAFLPGSQVDVRPMRDVGPLMNQPQLFQILKMDRRRGNIVVSRRAVLEERRAEERSSLVASSPKNRSSKAR